MDAAPLIKSRKALGKMKAIVWAAGLITLIATICQPVSAHVYNATLDPWNINKNSDPAATDILNYTTSRGNTTYTPSPDNWRSLPAYTVILDRFSDGEPSNNDFYGLLYEWAPEQTQMRYGGDIAGLNDSRALDYLEGMGIRTIYIAGTPWLNMPWGSDGYSAIDFTLLDPHFGTMADWISFIDHLHVRKMYLIMDLTVGTMGNFIGFDGYLNSSTPFSLNEYNVEWLLPTYAPWGLDEYPDWKFSNAYNESCIYPQFWQDDGTIVPPPAVGCYDSYFDQYGDVEAFGVFPDWQRQLAKFASVQDRLREWKPEVNQRLSHLACLSIQAFDYDGIRVDKATQLTVDALAEWNNATQTCARALGKNNFYISGEITGGDTFGAIYLGRGRAPSNRPAGFLPATTITPADAQYFLRDEGKVALDASAFHYSIYRSMTRFLGMDGNLAAAYDLDLNFITAWNEIIVNDDLINSQTGVLDPRHMFGVTNQDVFRWPSLTNGTLKNALGLFITTLVMPGIPLMYYGEEQGLYLYDSGAANYLYGRQPMTATPAWQRHGCYKFGSTQYYNMPLDRGLTGCDDDAAGHDHMDPTAGVRLMVKRMNELRATYPTLQDGLTLSQLGTWTHDIQLPGSNKTVTTLGMWSAERSALPVQQNNAEFLQAPYNVSVWLIYTNENATQSYTYDCNSALWISAPYYAPVTVQSLFYPYETYVLQESQSSYYNDSKAPWRGCLNSITLAPYDYKVLVPTTAFLHPTPILTGFTPGHDARLLSDGTNSFTVSFQYDQQMDCAALTAAITITGSWGNSTMTPSFGTPTCGVMGTQPLNEIIGVPPSAWAWTATVQNAPDGIYNFHIASGVPTYGGTTIYKTNSNDDVLVRRGAANNIMVFPKASDYSDSILTQSGNTYTITHNSPGADKFRYSGDYGQTWSSWSAYESTTTVSSTAFNLAWWAGQHILVQYWGSLAGSSFMQVHGDVGYTGGERRFPQLLARGQFNEWGFDSGISSSFTNHNGTWTMPFGSTWPSRIQLNVFGFNDYFYGDFDSDGVIDRLAPNALSPNYLNVSAPPLPYVSWTFAIDDQNGQWSVSPRGHYIWGVVVFALLLAIPPLTALAAALVFRYSFYAIKVNKWGMKPSKETSYFPIGKEAKGGSLAEKSVIPTNEKKKHHDAVPEKIIGWPEDERKRRKVLIATLEYEILDWKLKVKIGGLGVMSTLMGKAMTDVDLIWVVPKVKDLEYPQGDYAEPIEVIIFGEPYLIEVETHQLDNITYIILDSPVFRAQTKSDPYPQRMDDLSSAIFYSTWNQAIAETIRRYPVIDVYHINDYHGALAPLYLLPKILPVCLSLHNAEFQGLWPLRTKDEMKEVCAAFNIPKEVCSKYVQFGNTFNLLHAAASFISLHQKSIGVAGVSDKYGKRSWARYPALWTLRNIDSLPNPDPTDIAALEAQPIAVEKIVVDDSAEAERPENKRQAQEWAGLAQDPDADLFVFVGRWSKQKGVDLIADVMPAIIDKKPHVQLICVGPVIDLYGRFAAEKLARLMEMYPDRVYSKPEFTALPPYLFSGADFALIPSRDEPFGLVAVEFGRKGALGVGARLGGLGLMPGWWFPVESSATVHMLSQLTKTIKMALKSTNEERAILRARSAVQRFPVVEWRQRLEDFHRRSITSSRTNAGDQAYYYDMDLPPAGGLYMQQNGSDVSVARPDWGPGNIDSPPGSPSMSAHGSMDDRQSANPSPLGYRQDQPYHDQAQNNNYLSANSAQGGKRNSNRSSGESFYDEDPEAHHNRRSANGSQMPQLYSDRDRAPNAPVNPALAAAEHGHLRTPKFFMGGGGNGYSPNNNDIYEDEEGSERYHGSGHGSDMGDSATLEQRGPAPGQSYDNFLAAANRQIAKQSKGTKDPFMDRRQSQDSQNGGFASPSRPFTTHSRQSSFDSISSIMDEKGGSSPLNKAIVDFTDADGEVAQSFVQKLQNLSADNSKGDLCIEKYLMKSEKAFFSEVKRDRMSSMVSIKSSRDSFVQSRATSMIDGYRPEFVNELPSAPFSTHDSFPNNEYPEHFEDHPEEKRMSRLQIFLQRTAAGWPLYTIIISIGQLLGATSFQLTLLTGNNTLNDVDLYIIGAIFFVATLCWYTLFRMRPSVWVLSLPWILFAIAFFMIGLPSLHGPFLKPQKIITSVATWFYATASAAGFLFFGLNFGEEAGAATEIWILRACIVQGLQQIWVSVLWYWGSTLTGSNPNTYVPAVYVIYAVWPLSIISVAFAYMTFFGLPDYYRQIPPYVPNFFKTLFRRKLVIWFLVAEVLRDYWLSGPYGRNWTYLWSNTQIPAWSVVVMIAVFFLGIWGLVMGVLIRYSKVHSWLLPIFAVGLGCPRWAQMLWGTSGVALYLPWAGAIAPYLGTALWLWLGVLDAIQGVGLGMILLQTLSRLHVCATLALAQVIGSAVVMIARATAPDKVGPGNVFPNFALWDNSFSPSMNPLTSWSFWVCLICQIIIVIGYFIFFRQEQLSKP